MIIERGTGPMPDIQVMRHVDDERLWVAITSRGWVKDVFPSKAAAIEAARKRLAGWGSR